jgi:hypothetical protein
LNTLRSANQFAQRAAHAPLRTNDGIKHAAIFFNQARSGQVDSRIDHKFDPRDTVGRSSQGRR